MIKQLYGLMVLLILVPAHVVYGDDNRFNEMESRGIFGKIKFNMIVSCYTKKKPASEPVNLEKLKIQFPEKVEACTCFEEELSKTSNRQIYNDSRQAYQLSQEKAKAVEENDTAKLIHLSEKEKQFKPFMTIIVEKCDLRK